MRPEKNSYPPYYDYYIGIIEESSILNALSANEKLIYSFFNSIPENKREFAYQEGKWTIKELLQHINDAERILSYRALRFSRGDGQLLTGFEENNYVEHARNLAASYEDLLDEFKAIRKITYLHYKFLPEKDLLLNGKTHTGETTVLALGYMICGHGAHHISVIKERYLL
jgi:hypothetical protein